MKEEISLGSTQMGADKKEKEPPVVKAASKEWMGKWGIYSISISRDDGGNCLEITSTSGPEARLNLPCTFMKHRVIIYTRPSEE